MLTLNIINTNLLRKLNYLYLWEFLFFFFSFSFPFSFSFSFSFFFFFFFILKLFFDTSSFSTQSFSTKVFTIFLILLELGITVLCSGTKGPYDKFTSLFFLLSILNKSSKLRLENIPLGAV